MKYVLLIQLLGYKNSKLFFLIPAPPSPLIGSDGEHSQHSMSLPGQVSVVPLCDYFAINISDHNIHQ